ncbi:DUF6493 family protein [Arthrobacter sp. UYCu511]|uniref:DUF6493 family protein n=1 Tax=Arthrobacter sp. UYCu511 TaxID=3156337 RepID=UPI003396E25E
MELALREAQKGAGKYNRAETIATWFRTEPGALEQELWALFRVEGMGASKLLVGSWLVENTWHDVFSILSYNDAVFRERLTRECLDALLRNYSDDNINWYVSVIHYQYLTQVEVAAHERTLVAVLGSATLNAVHFAQNALGKVTKLLEDPKTLIDKSGPILRRPERILVKDQLELLETLSFSYPDEVGDIVAEVLGKLPPDLALTGRALVAARSSLAGGGRVHIKGPRREPATNGFMIRPPIESTGQLLEFLLAHYGGAGDGADIPRILEALTRLEPAPERDAVLRRSREVLEQVRDPEGLSPRRHLATATLTWLGESDYQLQDEWIDHESLEAEFESETEELDNDTPNSPAHILADSIVQARMIISGCEQGWGLARPPWPSGGTWIRGLSQLEDDTDVNFEHTGSVPVWTRTEPATAVQHYVADALDVTLVSNEFSQRAQLARVQDGFDQIVEWAAWFYRSNLDTLAAHAHPTVWFATQVSGAQGFTPLMRALGSASAPLSGPGYSALVLALSAIDTEQRACAADAVTALAASGFLDPLTFAAQLQINLAENFVLAGRVAMSLTRASAASPIAGYRVLQTLSEILPELSAVDGANELVELAAHLSARYGTQVSIPAVMVSITSGGSAMSIALRALTDVVPHNSELTRSAAIAADEAWKGTRSKA